MSCRRCLSCAAAPQRPSASISQAAWTALRRQQPWHPAHRDHRSAGFATGAVRLKPRGRPSNQPDGSPPGAPPQRQPSRPRRQSAELPAEQQPPAGPPAARQAARQSAARQPPPGKQIRGKKPAKPAAASSQRTQPPLASRQAVAEAQIRPAAQPAGIKATEWLAEHAPWTDELKTPADGTTIPSELSWTVEKARGVRAPQRVRVQMGQEAVGVLPVWIAVHQHHADGVARLYESTCPLSEDLVNRLTCHMEPFCITSDLSFSRCEAAQGPWRNYFVGVIGAFAPDEDDVLWPNQVLHRARVMYNVRNGQDLAVFLADPRREDFDAHSGNLVRLGQERGYQPAWAWHQLRSRWGDDTLASFGIDQDHFSKQ